MHIPIDHHIRCHTSITVLIFFISEFPSETCWQNKLRNNFAISNQLAEQKHLPQQGHGVLQAANTQSFRLASLNDESSVNNDMLNLNDWLQ